MNIKTYFITSLLSAGTCFAQWNYGPSRSVYVNFSGCQSFNTSSWSGETPTLSCSKVTVAEDIKEEWLQNLGVSRGKKLPLKDVFIAPSGWDPGQKKMLDFTSAGKFCYSFGRGCLNFLHEAIENVEILENYVPFTIGAATSPNGKKELLLHQGYYSENHILGKSPKQIYDAVIPGKMYLLTKIMKEEHQKHGLYTLQDNDVYKIVSNDSGKNSQVYVYDHTTVELNPVIGIAKGAKNIVKIAQAGIALSGLIKGVNGYEEISLHAHRPQGGMFDNAWYDPRTWLKTVESDSIKLQKALSGDIEYRLWLEEQAKKCALNESGFSKELCGLILAYLENQESIGYAGSQETPQRVNRVANFYSRVLKHITFRLPKGQLYVVIFERTLHSRVYDNQPSWIQGLEFVGAGYIKRESDEKDSPIVAIWDSSSLRDELGRDKPAEDADRILKEISETIQRYVASSQ